MELNKKAVEEFKELYRKEFKEEIDNTKARELAIRVLNLFRAVYGPLIKSGHEPNKRK